MQSYTVHEEPQPAADRIDRADNLVFIKDGFSWGAALFTPLWLLLNRLWWALLAYVVAAAALQFAGTALHLDPQWTGLVGIGLNLMIGFEADTLRRWALERHGWTNVGTITGRNRLDCERRFFETWLPAQPIISPPTSSAHLAPPPSKRGWPGFGSLLGAKS